MKVSVGSLDLGAVPMDLGMGDVDFFSHDDSKLGTVDPMMRVGLLHRSDSDPIDAVIRETGGLRPFGANDNASSYMDVGKDFDAVGQEIAMNDIQDMAPRRFGGKSGRNNNNVDDDNDDNDGDEEYLGDNVEMIPPISFHNPPVASVGGSGGGNGQFQLRIVVQPSPKTVYQRILRPNPSVLLEGAPPGTNFFVEVTLCTNDTEEPLSCLSGAAKTRISNGLFAQFKKLKITSTSQQLGSLLRLRFQLKTFNGTTFANVPGVVALSHPMEVFSHTHYLTNKKKGHRPDPPTVTDIIPCAVRMKGGCKLVVLGSNFVRCPQLKVKIGIVEVPANYHEQGTLWVIVPPLPAGRYPIAVTNDSIHWTQGPPLDYV